MVPYALLLGVGLTMLGCSSSAPNGQVDAGGLDVDAAVRDGDGGAVQFGWVDFIPVFEAGSAWESNVEARQMVETLFAEFEARLQTSGSWNATVEIYLTDDNTGFANTSFAQTFSDVNVDGVLLRVVPAWQKVVLGKADVTQPIEPDGTGADFTIHFNVSQNADNAGLLRHEIMHGLGAVNTLRSFTLTESGELSRPEPGTRIKASRYDLALVDLDKQPLLDNYQQSDGTFEVMDARIETTLTEWMDGSAGVFFRGVLPSGNPLDMPCGTFPVSATQGRISLNEPSDLMAANVHPTWDTLAAPDYAFLTAMGYQLVVP